MAGRPRLPISTFGAISTTEVGPGRFRATTRFRDWDGQSRKVTASGATRNAAETALKVELAARMRVGNLTATRIGEALALRKCDVNVTAEPSWVHITGTLVVHHGAGVLRQSHPKTHESNRVVAVPEFAVDVIRRRLTLIGAEDEEHLLFFTRNGKPLAPYDVRRTFREILRSAGLEGMGISPTPFAGQGRRYWPTSSVSRLRPMCSAIPRRRRPRRTTRSLTAPSSRRRRRCCSGWLRHLKPLKSSSYSPQVGCLFVGGVSRRSELQNVRKVIIVRSYLSEFRWASARWYLSVRGSSIGNKMRAATLGR